MSRVASSVLLVLLEMSPATMWAQDARAGSTNRQVTPELIRSKEAMVRRLLTDSPVARRIVVSKNAEAKDLFARAQQQYGAASAAFKAGDLAGADEAFNDAIWSVGKARGLVPDDDGRDVELKVRFGRLLESTDALKGSYMRHVAGGKADASNRELAQIEALIVDGKAQANTENMGHAIRALENAERLLMAAIQRVIGSATLDYAENFDSPAEEFAHELKRNKSFADLVPIAISELTPTEDAKQLVERYVGRNRALLDEAQALAGAKDFVAALRTLRSGTGYLQRALLAAGLVVPQQESRHE